MYTQLLPIIQNTKQDARDLCDGTLLILQIWSLGKTCKIAIYKEKKMGGIDGARHNVLIIQ